MLINCGCESKRVLQIRRQSPHNGGEIRGVCQIIGAGGGECERARRVGKNRFGHRNKILQQPRMSEDSCRCGCPVEWTKMKWISEKVLGFHESQWLADSRKGSAARSGQDWLVASVPWGAWHPRLPRLPLRGQNGVQDALVDKQNTTMGLKWGKERFRMGTWISGYSELLSRTGDIL